MRVALMMPPGAELPGVPAVARQAEALGFDLLACGEHLFFYGPTPNAFVVLAAAAGATTRIRLLSALTLLPRPATGGSPATCAAGCSAGR